MWERVWSGVCQKTNGLPGLFVLCAWIFKSVVQAVSSKNGVIFGESSTAPLFGKWNSCLCYYIRSPIPTRIPWRNFQFISRGTLKVSPRLNPIDFFENLGRSRCLIYCRKNLKKIRRKATRNELEPAEFHHRISNLSRFLRHSTNSLKINWGRPRSPAPVQKNPEKILGVGINDVLNSTKFRRLGHSHFWNIQLSTFWEFPHFSKS